MMSLTQSISGNLQALTAPAAGTTAVGNLNIGNAVLSSATPAFNVAEDVIQATTDALGVITAQPSVNSANTTENPTTIQSSISPTDSSADDFLSCAYEVGVQEGNPSKLIYLAQGEWTATNGAYNWVLARRTPQVFFDDKDKPLWGQVRYFMYIRSGYHFRMQVSPPRGAAGALVLTWVPGRVPNMVNDGGTNWGGTVDTSTLLNLPHAILDVRENSEVSLVLPYVAEENYIQWVQGTQDYTQISGGFVVVWVLSQLNVAEGTTNALTVTLFGELLDLDLQAPCIPQTLVPKSSLPGTRSTNPFVPDHLCYDSADDQGRRKMRRRNVPKPPPAPMEPRFIVEPGPGAANVANALVNKMAESTALANEGTSVDYATAGANCSLRTLYELGRRWQILHRASWGTSTTAGTQLWKGYFAGPSRTTIGVLLDKFQFFRGSFEIKLMVFASSFHQGRYSLAWVRQNGVDNESLSGIQNAVYVTGDIGSAPATLVIPFTNKTWRARTADIIGDNSNYGALYIHVVNKLSTNNVAPGAVEYMLLYRLGPDFQFFCPRTGRLTLNQTTENQLDDGDPVSFINFEIQKVNIHGEDHGQISNYFGRGFYLGFVNEGDDTPVVTPLNFPQLSTGSLARLMGFFQSEILLTVTNDSDSENAYIAHSFEKFSSPSFEDLVGLGAVIIPPGTVKTVAVPWYSGTPLRATRQWDADTGVLGYLYSYVPKARQSDEFLNVFVALRNPSFFFPLPSITFTRKNTRDRDDLSECGDVEENPGPAVVYKDRGLYKHYGIKIGNKIFHIDTDNVVASILRGEVSVMETEDLTGWEEESEEQLYIAEDMIKSGVLPNFRFSASANCETWVRHLIGDFGPTQGSTLTRKLALCVALGLTTTFVFCDDQNGVGMAVSGFLSKISSVVFGAMENEVMKMVIRTVVRIVCYLILYIQSPNLLSTGVLSALLLLDATSIQMTNSVKALCMSLVEGDFSSFCENLLESVQDVDVPTLKSTIPEFVKMQNLSKSGEVEDETANPKLFNDWTTCAKNIQWWIEGITKVVKWIREQLFPSETASIISWLEDHKDHISISLALADEHIVLMRTDKNYATARKTKQKHQALCDMISGLVSKIEGFGPARDVYLRANTILGRLQSLNFESSLDWRYRPEPLGVWIVGPAGCGKSFVAQHIIKKVAAHYNWETYANATGSNHMDGYVDQEIHLFDDFGQNRDEEDYALICNLISSVPFIVPKADLSAKGTEYKGRLVIATTNRLDFSSCKLLDPSAMSRRFPICLKLRAKDDYDSNGRLDVTKAMESGDLVAGLCWERDVTFGKNRGSQCFSERWEPMNLDKIVDSIILNLDSRTKSIDILNQSPHSDIFLPLYGLNSESLFDSDALDNQIHLFQQPRPGLVAKIRNWFVSTLTKIKTFFEKNRAWFVGIGCLVSLISLASMIFPKIKQINENVYSGRPNVKTIPKDFKVQAQKHLAKKALASDQSYDFKPICNRLVTLDGATGVSLGGKLVITYGHDQHKRLTSYRTEPRDDPIQETTRVTVNGEPMDLNIYTVDTNLQFKNLASLIHDSDYSGDGFLVFKKGSDSYLMMSVSQITPFGFMETRQGTESSFTYRYIAKTAAGFCGAVLVAPVNGCLKILGIHTSGNGIHGYANRLFSAYAASDEGEVVEKIPLGKPAYFQPRKTALKPSPLYDNPQVEPPVLSKHDPRLEVEVEDVTKKAAAKYIGNHFDPPMDVFEAAKDDVAERLAHVLSVAETISYEQATTSQVLDIDLSTSPGIKYPGKSKSDLIVDPKFKSDVLACVETPATQFACYLKDEVRPKEKVALGKTRAIEAANFDYTIAFRMVMGQTYRQIIDDTTRISGICVGINPYQDYEDLYARLYPNCICLDFKGFDGSLSTELLRHAVEVFSYYHSDPYLVKAIHEPTIQKEIYVSDELWKVDGGMASGSPCTSILNSCANLLAGYTVMASLGSSFDDTYICCYGDDCIISCKEKVDISNLAHYYKIFFGMNVTAADKSDKIDWVSKKETTFLKRNFKFFPGTRMIVGALDLDSMNDRIQWTRSQNDFKQQLDSYCLELALHGKEIYENQVAYWKEVNPQVKFPSWFLMERKVHALLNM